MSAHNITTVDGELRYMIQWFNEWSELQREDFLPILVDYLSKENSGVYVNGVVSSIPSMSCEDKPMSLFQCRVSLFFALQLLEQLKNNFLFLFQIKLFKEWSPKWPANLKEKLSEKIMEIDPEFGEKLKKELITISPIVVNGNANGNIDTETLNGNIDNEQSIENGDIAAEVFG